MGLTPNRVYYNSLDYVNIIVSKTEAAYITRANSNTATLP